MEKTEINWQLSEEEIPLVLAIAKRAYLLDDTITDLTSLMMDITACHLNGTELLLHDLLVADDPNFMHDVFGIMNHMDRNTGKLTRGFLPRYSA